MAVTPEMISNMEAAINAVLEQQKSEFLAQIDARRNKRVGKTVACAEPNYQRAFINRGVKCDDPQDAVKTVPEFDGNKTSYVSWRPAAQLFEPYVGSSRHFQAVVIIRNKIWGTLTRCSRHTIRC